MNAAQGLRRLQLKTATSNSGCWDCPNGLSIQSLRKASRPCIVSVHVNMVASRRALVTRCLPQCCRILGQNLALPQDGRTSWCLEAANVTSCLPVHLNTLVHLAFQTPLSGTDVFCFFVFFPNRATCTAALPKFNLKPPGRPSESQPARVAAQWTATVWARESLQPKLRITETYATHRRECTPISY